MNNQKKSTTTNRRLQVSFKHGGRYVSFDTRGMDDAAQIPDRCGIQPDEMTEDEHRDWIERHLEKAPGPLSTFKQVTELTPKRQPSTAQHIKPESTDHSRRRFWACMPKAASRCGLSVGTVKGYYYNRYEVTSLSQLTPMQWELSAAEVQAALSDPVLLDAFRLRVEKAGTVEIHHFGVCQRGPFGKSFTVKLAPEGNGLLVHTAHVKGGVTITHRDELTKGQTVTVGDVLVLPAFYGRRIKEAKGD